MKLGNINHPTAPFWNKIIVAAALAGGIITGYAHIDKFPQLEIVGIILMIVGTAGPVFLSKQTTQDEAIQKSSGEAT